MRQLYLAFALTSLFLTFPGTGVRAQNIVASQGFEGGGAWTFTEFPNTYNVSGDVWATVSALPGISPSEGSMFWGMQDLQNPNSGLDPEATEHTLTFADVTVSGLTDVQVVFDWNARAFNVSSEILEYEVIVDGVSQGRVNLITGASGGLSSADWETVTVPVADGSTTVSLVMYAIFNGGSQYAGFDNFRVTEGAACGITSFGPMATTICATNDNAPNTDTYAVSVPFSGSDANAVVTLTVDGTPAIFDDSNGNDPTVDAGGVLVLTSGDLVEGTAFEVTITGGSCNYSVTGSVDANACEDACDISFAGFRIICETFSPDDNTDGITVEIDYTGSEPGAGVTANGLTISGDDPSITPDGTIILSGAVEGGTYLVTLSGGSCASSPINIPVPVPSDACTPSALVINEVLADPGTTNMANDANGDGTLNSSQDEFIELFNTGTDPIDMTGIFVIETGANSPRYTFADGFMLPGRTAFVIFGGGSPNIPNCLSDVANGFLGFNNGSETISVRNAQGLTIAQMSYTSGPDDESLALSPDGDVASGYVAHTTIANPSGAPLTHSACLENDDPQFSLPVELLSFTASTTDKTVELAWATANEVANDRFVVERSAAGRQWEQIGTVRAAGRSNGDYGFTDAQPLNGRSLYRLRQIDLDGSFALYGPLVVEFAAGELAVYPNPAGNELRFNQQLEPTTATLFGGSGKVLRQLLVNDGRVDVSALRPGIYLLRVELEGRVETLRFVKQ